MNPTQKLTIRDIARLSGVSRSTVSLVINDDPRISAATKSRVREVIEASGFEPNTMARRLARRRAETVAVILPKTDSHVFADAYFAEAISGISNALSEASYRLLIEVADERFIENQTHRKLFREGAADGMLLLGTTSEDTFLRDLIDSRFPVVLVNSRFEGAAAVVADNRAGFRDLVAHLAYLGHRRIGFIGGLEITTVGKDRSEGFLEGLERAGLVFHEDLRLWGNYSERSGAKVARELLGRPDRPTAIMAANDMMAIGALRVAQREFGLRVPEDVTIVGADGIPLTTYVEPGLTTVAQPIYRIGHRATELLLEALQGRQVPTAVESMPTRLLVRGSSGAPPEV